MNCTEARELLGAYLDSELDARTVQEIRHHLGGCAECARRRQADQAFDDALRARLKAHAASETLWQAEKAFVVEAFRQQVRPADRTASARPAAMAWWSVLSQMLWPNPAYYAGLAAVWLLVFIANSGSSHELKPVASQRPGMTKDLRLALSRQHQEFREFLAAPDLSSSSSHQEPLPPRSQREGTLRNAGLTPWPRTQHHQPKTEESLA